MTPPARNVTTVDTHPAPGMTVRTAHEDGAFLRHVLFVGGWRVGEYRTDGGLARAVKRHADAGPVDNVRVTLDGETSFPAHDTGARWNGFVCPSFSRTTAEAIVTWNESTLTGEDSDRLSWDGDTIVIHSPVYAAERDYAAERVTPDAHGRYPLGAHGWTWQELDEE